MHLKEQYSEGEDSYSDRGKIKQLVNKYSDHISLPIQMRKEVWQEDVKEDENDDAPAGGEMVLTDEWENINKASALWTRSASEIEDDGSMSISTKTSLMIWMRHSHGRITVSKVAFSILSCYIFRKKPLLIYILDDQQDGLKLYVKRVFIMD